MRSNFNNKKLFWDNIDDRGLLLDVLSRNKVVVSSTDTIYGFLGNVTVESYDRICDLKKLSKRRAFLVLISCLGENFMRKLDYFVDLTKVDEELIKFLSFCWPCPLTVIFKAKPGLPDFMISEYGTVALRCPDHEGLQLILHEFHGLFSTSANLGSEPAPTKLMEISRDIVEKVDYVVQDKEEKTNLYPSSIIDFSDEDYSSDSGLPFKIIREGFYSQEDLKELYGKFRKSLR